MQKHSGIARPYALASFEYARSHQALHIWHQFLQDASLIIEDPRVAPLLKSSSIANEKLLVLCQKVLQDKLEQPQKNFLLLLAQNKRLWLLPQILQLFNTFYAAEQRISTVKLTTAIDVDRAFQEALQQTLAKRLDKQIHLETQIDPSLLGGAIIQVGDFVIDGSIRGKLNRLLSDLTR